LKKSKTLKISISKISNIYLSKEKIPENVPNYLFKIEKE
jgi:hypothetical protein